MAGTEEVTAPGELQVQASSLSQVRIGIAGYGTVGRAVDQIIALHSDEIGWRSGADLRVTRICRKTPRRAEAGMNGAPVTRDWQDVVTAADVDIVLETIGGTGVAGEVVRAALEHGKAVVTANKALIAEYGNDLFTLACKKRVPLGIEGTVGGGIPIIRAIGEALAADRIRAVYGIVNGTTNFILSRMETDGLQFDAALKDAQTAGYAEADPSLDIDGLDARDKITILARMAFRGALFPAQVPVTGIGHVTRVDFHYARRLDSTIRLVACAQRHPEGIQVGVRPWLVQRESMLARVTGPNNAIFLSGAKAGTQMFYGHGAGGAATGTAVLSDVIGIARHMARGQVVPDALAGFHSNEPLLLADHARAIHWYLRLTVADRPGILAQVAEAIAREGINIDSVVQEPHMQKQRLSFVVTLEPVCERTVYRAVEAVNGLRFMLEPALLLPMISEAG